MKKAVSEDERLKKAVRERYGGIASRSGSCCGPAGDCGCGGAGAPQDMSRRVGYSEEELASLPPGADLGLGCGNPVALASLKKGETVLDLGSGAGIDCFLAARKVGRKGRVIGVDMTPGMLERARANAARGGHQNVEFRLGEIENLPAADGSVDVVLSNCVINLVPDKERVFREVFRVLRPGGRMMVSDIVLTRGLPEGVLRSVEAHVGCIAGAALRDAYLGAVRKAGFSGVEVVGESTFPLDPGDPIVKAMIEETGLSEKELEGLAGTVQSIKVLARKPRSRPR